MIFYNLSNMFWRHVFFLCINKTEFSFFGITKIIIKKILEPNPNLIPNSTSQNSNRKKSDKPFRLNLMPSSRFFIQLFLLFMVKDDRFVEVRLHFPVFDCQTTTSRFPKLKKSKLVLGLVGGLGWVDRTFSKRKKKNIRSFFYLRLGRVIFSSQLKCLLIDQSKSFK